MANEKMIRVWFSVRSGQVGAAVRIQKGGMYLCIPPSNHLIKKDI